MSDKPITVAVATYLNIEAAHQDYDASARMKHEGQLDHVAIAVVMKDEDGELQIDRHDSTAKHLAWGGGVLGAAADRGGGAARHRVPRPAGRDDRGVGWSRRPGRPLLEEHPQGDRPPDGRSAGGRRRRARDRAVNPQRADLEALLANAVTCVVENDVVDADSALYNVFEQAEA